MTFQTDLHFNPIPPKEMDPTLSRESFQSEVERILQEGIQRSHSANYLTDQVFQFSEKHIETAQALHWPTTYQGIKNQIVLPAMLAHNGPHSNSDIQGTTGGHWDLPGIHATNLQSDNPFLNGLFRGLNNTVGLASVTLNLLNHLGGAIFFDLPAAAEDWLVTKGGPDLKELLVTTQAASPGIPIDDMGIYVLLRASQFSRKTALRTRFLGVQNRYPHGWDTAKSLNYHFKKHGSEFRKLGIQTKKDYSVKSTEFLQKAKTGVYRVKVDDRGVVRVWDKKNNIFGSYNSDGTVKTFFVPKIKSYWQRQDGLEIYP